MQTFPTPIPVKKVRTLLVVSAFLLFISIALLSAGNLERELTQLTRDQVVSVRIGGKAFDSPRDIAVFAQAWGDSELHLLPEFKRRSQSELDIQDRAGKHHRFKLSIVKDGEGALVTRDFTVFSIESKELAHTLQSYNVDIH